MPYETIIESISLTQQLEEIQLARITQAKVKLEIDIRTLIKSGTEVLNERLCHIITCEVALVCSVLRALKID